MCNSVAKVYPVKHYTKAPGENRWCESWLPLCFQCFSFFPPLNKQCQKSNRITSEQEETGSMQDLPSLLCQTSSQGCVRDVLCCTHRAFQRNSTTSKRTRAQYSAKCVLLVGILINVFQQSTINVCGPNGNLLFLKHVVISLSRPLDSGGRYP